MRPPVRAIARSTFHVTRPPAPLARPPYSLLPTSLPSQASCSRWFSCTHCRQAPSASGSNDFFSSSSSPFSVEPAVDDATSELAPVTAVSRLPLPPPLPYSPDSIPFRRHLDILQQSLTTHPDQSWLIYHSLHPSLKRYIPNRTYVALLSQQSNMQDPECAWARVEELLRFAEECGMQWVELGETILHRILKLGTECVSQVNKKKRTIYDTATVRQVWDTILRFHRGDLARVPSDVRRTWFSCLFILVRNNESVHARKAVYDETFDLLLQLLPVEDETWLRNNAGPLMSVRFTSDVDVDFRLARVRQLVYLHTRGIDIDTRSARRVVGAVREVVMAQKSETRWTKVVLDVMRDLDFDDTPSLYGRGTEAWLKGVVASVEAFHKYDKCDRRALKELHRARAVLANANSSAAALIAVSLPLAKYLHGDEHRPDGKTPHKIRLEPVAAVNVLLSLFERLAHRALADPHVMVAVITRKLIDYKTAGEPSIPPMILRFTKVLLSSDLLGHIDSKLVHIIFDLLVDISPSSGPAYNLARPVYTVARTMDSPYTWESSMASHKRWRSLFRLSLRPPHAHMHFASRLYADKLADGQTVLPSDMLYFIRAIGSQDSLSKYVLLERHLKDYLYFEYASLENFVLSLVKGLTARGRGREAWLGFHLSLRIMGSKPLTDEIYFQVIKCFSTARQVQDFRYCFGVLEYLDNDSELLPRLYDVMFGSLLQRGVYKDRRRMVDTEMVALAVDTVKHMSERNLTPSMLGLECLLRFLIAGGHHERAMQSLERIIRRSPEGDAANSTAISRIVEELIKAGHLREASKALEQYRHGKLSPEWRRVQASLAKATTSAEVTRNVLMSAGRQTDGFSSLSKEQDVCEASDLEVETTPEGSLEVKGAGV